MFLRRNDTGPAVSTLVKDLKSLGYYTLASTDTFDLNVFRAVKYFQMQNADSSGRALVVDGIAGPLTLAAVSRRLKGGAPPNAGPIDSAIKPSTSGGSKKARAALALAIAEYAAGRGESGGNNKGPDVKKYLNGVVGEGSNWCAGFVSWCFANSDGTMPYKYTVGARDTLSQLKKKGYGVAVSDASPPLPGDIVVWWRVAKSSWEGHIGIVVDYKDGVIRTVEGNKTPKVGVFSYTLAKMDKLLGFARIP